MRAMPWATSDAERREREEQAARLVGQRITAVRYFEIDDRRTREQPDDVLRGAREVVDAAEWAGAEWRHDDFDAIDYGLELDTADGATFGAVWEQAGFNEGLSFRPQPLRPERLTADGPFAVWDVTSRSRWTPFVGRTVTAVELRWGHLGEPESDLCCRDLVLRFGGDALHLVLGDAGADGRFRGATDNVAILDDALARRLGVGGYAEG